MFYREFLLKVMDYLDVKLLLASKISHLLPPYSR